MSETQFHFVAGSETSEAAAKRVNPRKAETDRAMILDYIRTGGREGRTDIEIQDALEMQGSTQRPRRNELAGNGSKRRRKNGSVPFWPVVIVKSGRRRNGGAVWVVA